MIKSDQLLRWPRPTGCFNGSFSNLVFDHNTGTAEMLKICVGKSNGRKLKVLCVTSME